MYFKIILTFLGAVSICGQRVNELCHSYGCFDSSDTHVTLTLDGNDIYYADFKKDLLIWESRLPTAVRVPWAYEFAAHYRAICQGDLQRWKPDKSALTKTKVAPEVIIYSREDVIKEEKNTLICNINHFFPPSINIRWTKNDVEVTVEDPFNKCLPNSDGTFFVLSTLDFIPKEGDIYGCTVEHESLEMPLTKFWKVETNEINETFEGPAVFCGLGLSLGLLGVAGGTFFFVKGNQYQSMVEAY